MINKTYKVSILIPAFNPGVELLEAIKSAVNQLYTNIEILVVDDGSENKKYLNIAKEKYLNEKKIKFFSYENNKGVSAALNFGVLESKGDFISWLSHDDVYSKYKIKKQIEYINKNEHIKILSSNAIVFNRKANYFKKFKLNKFKFTTNDLFYNDKLNGCGLIICKKILEEFKFDEKLRYTQDYDLWLRISKKYTIFHYEKFLIFSRKHSGQDTIVHNSEAFKEIEKLNSNYLNEFVFDTYYYNKFNSILMSVYNYSYRGNIKIAKNIFYTYLSLSNRNYINISFKVLFVLLVSFFGLSLNKIKFIYNYIYLRRLKI